MESLPNRGKVMLKRKALAEATYALALGVALDGMVHDLAEKAGG